jgi:basic amino acid/polyamine antiporter, APA family
VRLRDLVREQEVEPGSRGATSRGSLTLLRELGLRDATVIVAGTVIGSGIFVVPNSVANQLSSFLGVLAVWVVGGVLSLAGALALGELGAAFPGTGGLYVYLRHVYGRPIGFLYGWSLLTLVHSGSIATLAVAFRLYLARVLPLSLTEQKLAGFVCILFLTGVNCFGVRSGKTAQYLFTTAKLGGLAVVIGALYLWGHFGLLAGNFWPRGPFAQVPAHFGIALIGVLWAYEGWHVVSFTAGEFKNPQRDLPRGLLYGTLIIAAAYLMANIGYYCVLSAPQIAQTERVAAAAVTSILGGTAGILVSVVILVAIAGSLNGNILTGPRVYYAMAEEGLFFPAFGKLSARFRVPVFALLIQGAWSACLTLVGTFQELFTCVIFTAWIFYGLAVGGVIVLRTRHPEIKRPFRSPGYPWLPALFVASAFGVTLSAVISSPLRALIGIGLVLTGLPFFLLFFFRSAAKETTV